eukprot:SAG31_NODE_1157_length_9612_cov_6.630401_2_plen_784_part_00
MVVALTPEAAMLASSCTDPQISPDGRWIAYMHTAASLDTNSNDSAIFVVPLDDAADPSAGTPRRVAAGRTPRFSPDSTELAFVQGGQLWLIDAAAPGGAPRQLSSFTGGLGGPLWADNSHRWSPDGQWIACVTRGNAAARGYNPWAPMDPAAAADDVLATERIFHKWEQGYNPAIQSDGSYTACHIWLLPVASPGGRCARTPVQLTDGGQDDHSIAWSPDSSEVCFVSNRTGDWDNNNSNDLFAVDHQGGVRRVTTGGPAVWADGYTVFTPVWSPDGRWIACSVSRPTSKDSPSADTHVGVVPAAGGRVVDLTSKFDRRVQYGPPVALAWTEDSERVVFPAFDAGARHVYSVAVTESDSSDTVLQHTRGRQQLAQFSVAGHSLAVAVETEACPSEIFRYAFDWKQPQQSAREAEQLVGQRLTAVNAHWQDEFHSERAERFECHAADGQIIEGWTYKPWGWREGAKFPAVMQVHGGPHGMHGYTYRRHGCATASLLQVLSGAGFGVIVVNPRGSSGYGQHFADGSVGDWGGMDYQDLMSAVAAAVEIRPWIDEERLGICGGSFGGFMCADFAAARCCCGNRIIVDLPALNIQYSSSCCVCRTLWAVGHTHRFKAAVAHVSHTIHQISHTRILHAIAHYDIQSDGHAVDRSQFFSLSLSESVSLQASFSNHVSFYGCSMYQLVMEEEFLGTPYESDLYWERSPLRFVKEVQTPVLLTHGELDHEVAIEQSEQMFTALKKLRKHATFVRFPREGHGIEEPAHVIEFLKRHVAHFKAHLGPGATAKL